MRRGNTRGLLGRLGRALRHGMVVSGVCVLIALFTGVSGFVFGERPATAHGQVPPPREAAATSSEVLEHWLKPPVETSTPSPTASPEATQPAAVTEESTETPTPTATATPDPGDGRVVAQRVASSDQSGGLQPGDRTVVSLSFYYCQEVAGAPRVGDGGGFCGLARDGSHVRDGVAACDAAYLGQRFRIEGDPTGRTYVCADTGSAVHGLHRDIWFQDDRDGWDWQQTVGRQAPIDVLP